MDTRSGTFGELILHVTIDDGQDTSILFQLADVSRPLLSVSSICDRGNRVVFGRGGGVVGNIETGQEIPFERRGGLYHLGPLLQAKKGAPPSAASMLRLDEPRRPDELRQPFVRR